MDIQKIDGNDTVLRATMKYTRTSTENRAWKNINKNSVNDASEPVREPNKGYFIDKRV